MDNRPEDKPVFGQEPADGGYVLRPGAYAVILSQGRLAVIRTARGYYLPGGGCEPGEKPEDALRREVREECGRAIEAGRKLGEAVEYVHAEGRCYRIDAAFFPAALGDTIAEAREPDHHLVWLEAREAMGLLVRQSQAWAVRLALGA